MSLAGELATVLAEHASARGVPGACAGIIIDDEVVTASYGVTSIEDPVPVNSATLFQVGSITKTFTSAAIQLLADDGALAFDDPVAKHLPELGATTGLDANAITIEHLLSHQSGFDGDHLFAQKSADVAELRNARRLFEPGAAYSYNNAAFSIAGLVIEEVSGEPFERFMRQRFFKPLGMHSACFRADDAIVQRVAMPHVTIEGTPFVIRRMGWQPGWELQPIDWPAGGLIASVEHLVQWCRYQWTNEAQLRLHTPVVNAHAINDVALDWVVRRSNSPVTIEHMGSTAGYLSDLVVVPSARIGFVGLTNSTIGDAMNTAVRRWALERVAGIREEDPVANASSAPDASTFVGKYLGAFWDLDVAEGTATGTFVLTATPRADCVWQVPAATMTFGFCDPENAVTIDETAPVQIARFGDGWMLFGGRMSPKIA
jgi:CubicO group peptidase (beta-lactamase class C family)